MGQNEIYNKWIDKITCAYKTDLWIGEDGETNINAKRTKEREKYLFRGFPNPNIVLIECPIDVLVIEFESDRETNIRYINETKINANNLNIQYCIVDHEGKSPYFYAFNLEGLPEGNETIAKKQIAMRIVPIQSIELGHLDVTNLGKTLIPVIEHPHWKAKYNGNIHKIIEGIPPLSQVNNIKDLIIPSRFENKNKEPKRENETIKKIFEKTSLLKELQNLNIDLTKNPTMCPLGHESHSKKCFSYDLAKGLWYCFHCTKGGDLINLIIESQNIQFKEAINRLCEKYQIQTEPEIDMSEASSAFNSDKFMQAKKFIEKQPLYYDRAGLWWIWNNKEMYWSITDETELMNDIVKSIGNGVNTINSTQRGEILQALKQIGRLNEPQEIPKEWIQFKNKIIDIKSNVTITPDSKYFCLNPIPWSIGETDETPTMDKLFEDWVGKDYVNLLYEIIAYSMYRHQVMARIFCMVGLGSNGKSTFLSVLRKFIGLKNTCTTDLDNLLNNRFALTNLHKKLVCEVSEINEAQISKTQLLKRLCEGKDNVLFEYKFARNLINEPNYAKLIISANKLPTSLDTSDGWYRRWIILDFNGKFSEKKDILEDIPDSEFEALALKSIGVLQKLLIKREFHNEGTIETRKQRYEERSNPFDKFWNDFIVESPQDQIPKFEFKRAFDQFCKERGFRVVSDMILAQKMKERGVETIKYQYFLESENKHVFIRQWAGISWKPGFNPGNQ